ncbi:hypothetical protein Acsp04_28260 [Actinomadura sp. NBRC 104425]|nr:hypothetical protein [Actinomadura sp. NBRC 104425]GLZ12591.1 hypothetical protein Acsp04_28260 [Actinomadura sp. NBRC 104425]
MTVVVGRRDAEGGERADGDVRAVVCEVVVGVGGGCGVVQHYDGRTRG